MSNSSLVDQLDLDRALTEELQHIPDLLPKQLVDMAVAADPSGVAEHMRQLALAEVPIQRTSAVVAFKWRHGRRHVTVLPLYERVLYRAVVASISGRPVAAHSW